MVTINESLKRECLELLVEQNPMLDKDSILALYNDMNLEYTPLDIIDYSSESMKAEITLNDSNILFIPIPNNGGWRIYANSERINPISVNGGFIGLPLKEGTSIIEMKFVPRGIIAGLLLSVIGTICLLLLLIKDINIVKLRINGDEKNENTSNRCSRIYWF